MPPTAPSTGVGTQEGHSKHWVQPRWSATTFRKAEWGVVKCRGVTSDCVGLHAGRVPPLLCDLKPVTQMLCASVSSALKWDRESFCHLPRLVVRIK